MNGLSRTALLAAAILGLFAIVGTGLVSWVHHGTADRIQDNQRRTLEQALQNLVPQTLYDNDLTADAIELADPELGTTQAVSVYRARKAGKPVAAVLATVAPDGYSGEIRLLVAIKHDGKLAGVRVLQHKETPGLGDPIEEGKSDWILKFAGLSLVEPTESQWKVKRDGGTFDQFTGATITPRAVVKAVHRSLAYFEKHRKELFDAEPETEVDPPVQ